MYLTIFIHRFLVLDLECVMLIIFVTTAVYQINNYEIKTQICTKILLTLFQSNSK